MASENTFKDKAATGVPGLDEVLAGGLSVGNVFLIEGEPGAGKTTIALKFLMTGAAAGEQGLYITLSESEAELRAGAASHGWTLDGKIEVFELTPPESLLDGDRQQSLLYSSDLELGETTTAIFEAFERVKPTRVVLDSLSEIRLLAQSSLRYRQPDPGHQALLLATRHDGAVARRSDRRQIRQNGAQRRAWRHPSRGTDPQLRRGTPPSARLQVPGAEIPRRIPRFLDPGPEAWRSFPALSRANTAPGSNASR